MRRHRHLAHPALLPLWKSLERDWLLQLLAVVILLTAACVTLLIGLRGHPAVLLLGLGALGLGGVFLFRLFYRPSPLQTLQERLYDRPDTVVWVYGIVHQHHPFGLQFNERGIIYFKFSDGDELSAYLPPGKLKLISKVLARALPDTVFGYTKEREARYARDPRRLD